MKNNYRRFLKILLLFAFVSLMLCPYAEVVTASHGGKLLIQQDDFKKTKKLVKYDLQVDKNPIFLSIHTPLLMLSTPKKAQQVANLSQQIIILSITSTVQLLL